MDAEAFANLKKKLWKFMIEDVYPNEQLNAKQYHEIGQKSNEWYWSPILVQLKRKAKSIGLWNMFLPVDSAEIAGKLVDDMHLGCGLTNRQYAEICEILGTSSGMEFASQCTNCTSPDTGNMEVLARYGTYEQKKKWLIPLLQGTIRSCFAMTEPGVASSDATNIGIRIRKDNVNKQYIINGRKWYITGAGSLHCKIMILMGKTDPTAQKHKQQSQILIPMNTPGITLSRPMGAFGHVDVPKGHMEIYFNNVRVPFKNVILGEGRGFEISQGRLGPGRIHHCMRLVGSAERSLSLMCKRVNERKAFGKKLIKFDTILQDIAKSRCEIETCRLLVYKAASMMDIYGNKDYRTRQLLSLCKAYVPITVQYIVDRCIQAFGAMGVSQDVPLPGAFKGARTLRLADGPDEVHWRTAARLEMRMQQKSPLYNIGYYPVDSNEVFRNTTDQVSQKTKDILKSYSKL